MIYRLAEGIRLEESAHGGVLVSARPLRMVRLSPALVALIRQLPTVTAAALPPAHHRALERLEKKGFIERRWEGLKDLSAFPRVSIIIPVKDRADDLRHCLQSLQQLDYPCDRLQIVVVDDGSSDASPDVARQFGATLVCSGSVGGGPALARNKGVSVARGEILAFIDSDCTAAKNWLADLLPTFNDPQVAAVGGWVDGMHYGSALDRYEAVMSSLNLGRREMCGAGGNDTFYLPSCNLLMRKEAFCAAGGFRAELHVGEDVDLTWRLRDSGWKIRYVPRGTVYHAHRSLLWPFMKRRFDYGTSEGTLHRLHPLRGKKMVAPPMLSAILLSLLAALLTLTPALVLVAGVLLGLDLILTRRRLHRVGMAFPNRAVLLARTRALGSLGYYMGYHVLRYYLLPFILVALFLPSVAALLLLVFCGVSVVDYRVRKPRLFMPSFCFFYAMEQLAYGLGVLWGCITIRSASSYALAFKAVH